MNKSFDIIDISQPISRTTACFPGDVPFSRDVTMNFQDSGLMNLCAFTMSPHVGTHADSPVHIHGDLQTLEETAGTLPLSPYVGPAFLLDVTSSGANFIDAISWDHVKGVLAGLDPFPQRILFKTAHRIRYELWEKDYAWFSEQLVEELGQRGVTLIGIDTPSVDQVESKTLETHHALLKHKMSWLENLDLTSPSLKPGREYFMVALPLKLMELEASPVRAILLD